MLQRYTWTAGEITEQCQNALASFADSLRSIQTCDSSEIFNIFAKAENDLALVQLPCEFPQYVSTDPTVREASEATERLFSANNIETFANVALYQRLKDASVPQGAEHYWKLVLEEFERNGLALPQEQRDQLVTLQKRIADLCTEMNACLNAEDGHFFVDQAGLKGCSPGFVSGLPVMGTQYKLTCKYTDVANVLEFCEVDETRKRMDLLFNSRAAANEPRFRELIQLRHQVALLLGFENYAAFALKPRMAASLPNVMQMYDQLLPRIESKAKRELAELTELAGEPINHWNIKFWQTKRLLERFNVDKQLISKYLPTARVLSNTLELYQELLDLRFTKIEFPAWHSSVDTYEVYDKDQLIGHFFLDLFPRDNKYNHAAEFTLSKAIVGETACAALVCNFSSDFLMHEQFVTLYHEFGHLMHELLGKSQWSRCTGTSVERDFVEAPSQMLENWVFQKEILQRVGRDSNDQPMPDELIDALLAARSANTGVAYMRQAFYGKVDLAIHSSAADPHKVYADLLPMTLVSHQPAPELCGWNHLFGGYAAGYYGYLWADQLSADMFSTFGNDCMNRDKAQAYRKSILEAGANRPAKDSLFEFLGREPQVEAFCQRIGIN